ncbi:MAG: SpoIIE family protein phosphatase, partial [Oscillospiraceae bacterium]|nr:SpoIIE family protein phosphatase [Oscillospiraceae bacterium]
MSTDQKKTKRRLGIGTRLIIGVCIFGIVLGIVASAIGYSRFTKVIERRYNENAYEIAYTAGSYINGDRLREYAQTLEKDEEYDITQAMLDELCENTNTTTIYVALAHPEDWCTLTYVYDSIHSSTGWSRYELGYVDEHAILPDFTWVIQDIIEQNNIHKDTYIYTYNLASGDHTNVIVPVLDSSGEIVGIIGVEKAMTALNEARVSYVKSVLFYTFTTLVLFILVYIWILNRQIIKPVLTVKNEAQAFVQQDAQVSTVLNTIDSGDEVGDLAQAVYQMELDIRSYITNLTAVTAEKERIGAELDVAKHIQVSMLPSIFPSFPDRDEFDVYATMTPAKEVGGDFYDFYSKDRNHIALLIADVSGKGIPAALFMMTAKTLIHEYVKMGANPGEALERANNELSIGNDSNMFVTAWLAIIDLSNGHVRFANAGHNRPAIRHAGEPFAFVKQKTDLALAAMEGMPYREQELTLLPGDTLFVFTDGVSEATNSTEELYDESRLLVALNTSGQSTLEGLCGDSRRLLYGAAWRYRA